MILLYFICIPPLIVVIWLVIEKKWKALIWFTTGLIVVIAAGWYLFLGFVSAAFKNECETAHTWNIDGYEIIEKRCIGFAGPPWYPVYLFQNDIEIDYVNSKSDSCLVEFTNEIGETLQFDLCAAQFD